MPSPTGMTNRQRGKGKKKGHNKEQWGISGAYSTANGTIKYTGKTTNRTPKKKRLLLPALHAKGRSK